MSSAMTSCWLRRLQELAIKDDESFAAGPRHATKESDLPNSLSERNSTERYDELLA
jgi:hypothetical protein